MTDVDECERDPTRAWRDNLEATRNLAEAAAALNARLIHFSTDYVFDGQKSSPYIELDSPNPLSVYGKTKLAAERAVSSLVENYAIIRVAWLFGVKGDFVSFVKGEIAQGRSPRLATDHRGSPGYIPDLLAAIQQIAKSDVRGIFHLTNSGYCDRFQMGQEIIRIPQVPRSVSSHPDPDNRCSHAGNTKNPSGIP
jgi:dTDP-4-dehydrorhamnose reductase